MQSALATLLAALALTAAAAVSVGDAPARALGGSSAPANRVAPPVGDGDGSIGLNQIGTFVSPVHVNSPPGYPKLVFVVEQPGVVRTVLKGKVLGRPFLDIRDLTICGSAPDDCGEQGLLSIAFPPDYRESRRFYVYFTDPNGDNLVAEFKRSRSDPTTAIRSSLRPVLPIAHPVNTNHNGGQLAFRGQELFISTGDGGSGGDPPNNAQNVFSLLGKLLRINPSKTKGGRPYGVPRSNPFVDQAGRDEIFSYGLRNPFRFSFQERNQNPDRVLIADVGQRRFEELDYVELPSANGANFGWDAFEGFAPYDCGAPTCSNTGTADPGGTTPPIFTYGHGSFATPGGPSGCSITGGFYVRDRSLTSLYRRYVWADFCEGELRSLIPTLTGALDEGPLGVPVEGVTTFGETPDGRVYVASLDGSVYRLVAR